MQRNRAQICSFFVRGECKRGAECPYRHEMPLSGELAEQNIRDRYYGINDPVARKMMRRLGERIKLEPPEDTEIKTLYVGNIEPEWREDDLREVFDKHGSVVSVKMVHGKSCAFVTYATRAEAEAAADKLHDALIINGTRCKLLWGKPQQHQQKAGAAAGAAGGALPPLPGAPDYFGMPAAAQYPSMDPNMMGSAVPSEGGAPPPGQPQPPLPMQPPHMRPPPGVPLGPGGPLPGGPMGPPPMFYGAPRPGGMPPPLHPPHGHGMRPPAGMPLHAPPAHRSQRSPGAAGQASPAGKAGPGGSSAGAEQSADAQAAAAAAQALQPTAAAG